MRWEIFVTAAALSASSALGWEPMPDGYEIIDGPPLRDHVSIDAWRSEWDTWKAKELQTVRYDADGACTAYNMPSLKWTQRSFVQVFAMLHDRTLFDRARNVFTVDTFLTTLDIPVDSVLFWPSYPNLGIDARNQWDLWATLPGGLPGVRALVDAFHAHNVTVFLPYLPWDGATRDPDPEASRYISDIANLHALLDATGADGVNGDTLYGVPTSFANCSVPTAACPEGGVPTQNLALNSMSWGYYYGFSQFPPVSRTKFLDARHTPLVCARWSLGRSLEFQIAFFNGAGYVVWENIWGIWNAMTPREWTELNRTATILRQFPEAMHSRAWRPFVPDLPAAIHGSAFPDNHMTVYTFIRAAPDDYSGVVALAGHAAWTAHDAANIVAFDLYHGQPVHVQAKQASRVAGKKDAPPSTFQVPLTIEGYGYGAILLVHKAHVPTWLPSFLASMHEMTKTPLKSYSTARPLMQQHMTSLPTPKAASTAAPPADLDLVPIDGTTAWNFTVNGVQIEPVLKWTPNGNELYGVGVQFPWESRPSPHHEEELWLDRFDIMKHPVTNAQFAAFLRASAYAPRDLDNFLLSWRNRRVDDGDGASTYRPVVDWTVPAAIAQHPVVHVALEDAQAFAAFYGLRLPHDWEWQFVASNGVQYTQFPWGEAAPTANKHVPRVVRGGVDAIDLVNVGSFPAGCASTTGVCDLVGLVWEMTDSFCDPRTCSLLLRGGSLYQPVASSLNDPNWYFPAVHSVAEHGKWLLLGPSYDRAATVGFRCVRDVVVEHAIGGDANGARTSVDNGGV
ncbi:Aste57867_18878 [Aphanomyces stellatus]|uniref:Aste57867_18878 protein n=1 Tax=Aphanomyces stellatus TaxID=120398 RepID=A0A485LC32_9STRA|nr:hypothetical protein As57867_018814 [Aphanomyces stellatus]VFT95612.1 Aste57867_18878 [Aphanomyces stellatus]